jgi:hypothetical protein
MGASTYQTTLSQDAFSNATDWSPSLPVPGQSAVFDEYNGQATTVFITQPVISGFGANWSFADATSPYQLVNDTSFGSTTARRSRRTAVARSHSTTAEAAI